MITGEKFLRLNKSESLEVTKHARIRMCDACGTWVQTEEELLELFKESKQVKIDDIISLGYRPRYGSRKSRGEDSWYFRFFVNDVELIAVISKKEDNELRWVTTYSPSLQTEIYRKSGIRGKYDGG